MTEQAANGDLEALGALYAEQRTKWEEALKDLPDDDTYYVTLAERLGVPLPPPTIHNDGMGLEWCDVCGSSVVKAEQHQGWHVRLMAATKTAQFQAVLAHLGAQFLGLVLGELISAVEDEADAEASTPAVGQGCGHGWIYPAGDPPGSMRARCGGPALCDKCRGDEHLSLMKGDGAAEAYYAKLRSK